MTAPHPKELFDARVMAEDIRNNAFARGVSESSDRYADNLNTIAEGYKVDRALDLKRCAALMREAAAWIRHEVDGLEHIKCYEKSQEAWCKAAEALIARLEEGAK